MKTVVLSIITLISFSSLAISFAKPVHELVTPKHGDHSKIEWLDFETAIDKNEEKKKPIFIDIYTGWCGWCKKMDATTFQDEKVVKFMNENFYAVKMDAESREPIAFKEKLYEYKKYGKAGYNELAVSLLNSKMSFPSFVVLSKRQVKVTTIAGYQKPNQLISRLEKYAK